MMKSAANRSWSDPEKAARKLLEIANDVEVVQDGRIYIELINGPFLFRENGTPDKYKASRSLQSICKDMNLVIRFSRMACGGGNDGCEGDFGKEVCCAA